jgi:hypothetical protein
MTRLYRVLGKPAGAPVDLLVDRPVGTEFQATLDKDVERTLVDAGALEVVKQSVKDTADDKDGGQSPKAGGEKQ